MVLLFVFKLYNNMYAVSCKYIFHLVYEYNICNIVYLNVTIT